MDRPRRAGALATLIALLLISPPLVIAAYEVLRDDELEPYRGLPLDVRSALLRPGLRGPLGRVLAAESSRAG